MLSKRKERKAKFKEQEKQHRKEMKNEGGGRNCRAPKVVAKTLNS